ncbi:hypothetical protein Q7P37_011160 [Cladosporium fusiforme]
MSSLESQLADAVKDGKIPQAVVYAATRDGKFQYKHAVGKSSLEEGAADIKEDAVFLLASQTKLMTAVAAQQILERGLFGIDDDVADVLPELAKQPILKGFDEEDKPILEPRKVTITLRHLLTFTAGVVYDAADANLIKYQAQRGQPTNTGTDVVSRFSYPLVYEPGTQWSYGTALDWAGLLVERVTNSTLESYMKANIWDPLGVKTMTFFPSTELKARVPALSVRRPDGKLSFHNEGNINTGSTGCFGGHGAYSSMQDYMTFLQSLLANDGKLLKPESVDSLFKPQLTAEQAKALKGVFASPMGAFFVGEFFVDKYQHDWSFGGAIFVEGYEDGRRRAGTVAWGGAANTFWALDREAGLILTFGTQVIPPGDASVREVVSVVEKAIYELAGATSPKTNL